MLNLQLLHHSTFILSLRDQAEMPTLLIASLVAMKAGIGQVPLGASSGLGESELLKGCCATQSGLTRSGASGDSVLLRAVCCVRQAPLLRNKEDSQGEFPV